MPHKQIHLKKFPSKVYQLFFIWDCVVNMMPEFEPASVALGIGQCAIVTTLLILSAVLIKFPIWKTRTLGGPNSSREAKPYPESEKLVEVPSNS